MSSTQVGSPQTSSPEPAFSGRLCWFCKDLHSDLVKFSSEYLAQSRGPAIVASGVLFQVISTIFVLARVYSRSVLLRSFLLDDYILVVAWLLGTGLTVVTVVQVQYGMGHHAVALAPQSFIDIQHVGYFSLILYGLVLPLVKLSMCITYRRIFYTNRPSRIIIDTTAAVLVLSGTGLILFEIFQCTPIEAFWTKQNNLDSRCHDVTVAYYMNGVSSLVIDLVLMLVVIPQVLKLKIHRRQRIALLLIISLAWLAIFAGIIRMVRTSKLIGGKIIDPIWSGYDISIWLGAEVHISLFVAAAPYTKPLVIALLPRLLGSTGLTNRNPSAAPTTIGGSSSGGGGGAQKFGRASHGASHPRPSIGLHANDTDRILGPDRSWIALKGGDEESLNSGLHDETKRGEGRL